VSLAHPRTATTTRDAIVAVLDGIPGLTGYGLAPDQATAGAAWPRWVQTTYDGALCTLAKSSYDVLVTLPGDYAEQTVDQGDAFRDTVALALVHLGRIDYAEPVGITFSDSQTMPGLRLRLVIT
jgi:hypothetical protein